MTKQFVSFKSLIEYIRSLESLPYERDVEDLRCVADSVNAITSPKVMVEDDCITIEDGSLDEEALDSELTNCRDSFSGFAADSGIVVTVKIGDLEFEKESENSQWRCSGDGLRGLPLGYDDEEFEGELDLSYVCDEYDLVSEAIDAKVNCYGAFSWEYRMFQSVDDDIYEIATQLGDLEYDGFYYLPNSFYGWRKGVEEPWENFDPIQLLSSSEVAFRCAQRRGWLDE